MPGISGLDDLKSRICRKNNPSPRAAQAFFYNCTTEFSFQYDKQSLRPRSILANSKENISVLSTSVLKFAEGVFGGLGLDGKNGSLSLQLQNAVLPVLLGCYVVISFDEDEKRSEKPLKLLGSLADKANLPSVRQLFSSSSQGFPGLSLYFEPVASILKQATEEAASTSTSGNYETVSIATISKCCLYRALRLVELHGNVLAEWDAKTLDGCLSSITDIIIHIYNYDCLLSKLLAAEDTNSQRQKSFLYELSATAASFGFAAHLLERIAANYQKEMSMKKPIFSKVANLFICKLQANTASPIVGLDSHSLSFLWALHKLFSSTQQTSYLQQSFLISVAWITSSSIAGNTEEIARRARFPFVSKLMVDIYSKVDKTSSAKMWFLALEQLHPAGNQSTLFQLWRTYIDQWSKTMMNDSKIQDQENTSPLEPIPTMSNRYTLSRAVLFSSKTITCPEDRINFMFKELNIFASAGSFSQFSNDMRTILRCVIELSQNKKDLAIYHLAARVKMEELALSCWPTEYSNFAVDIDTLETPAMESPLISLLLAEIYLHNFLKGWYERQCPKPDDLIVYPNTQADLLKSYGTVIPDAANRPICNCFDHAIITPKFAAEYCDTTETWLSLLRKSADILLKFDSLSEEIPDHPMANFIVKNAVTSFYTCTALLLLMREHVRALACYLRLRSWVSSCSSRFDIDEIWHKRLDRLQLQLRIHLLESGLEDPLDSPSALSKSQTESISFRMRYYCATSTCSSSVQSEASSMLIECPAHPSKQLGKCTPLCRWLLSSPLCTSFWASNHAISELFQQFDRSRPFKAKYLSGPSKSAIFADVILKFADLLDAMYFASDICLVAGIFRDSSRAAYEGLRYSLRFASVKWAFTFQLQMLESLKFQDKIQHASHYKILTDAAVSDKVVNFLINSKEVDNMLLGSRLSMKYKIWHELRTRLADIGQNRLTRTADWLQSSLVNVTSNVRNAIKETPLLVNQHCVLPSPLANVQFSAWLHYFDFATRFPGNDLELILVQHDLVDHESSLMILNQVMVSSLPALPSPDSKKKPDENNYEDLSKVLAPRKPSYEALANATQVSLNPVHTGGRSLRPKGTGKGSSASSSNKMEEASLQLARYFPLAPVYSELCRLRAVKSHATGASPMITAYWLHEANSVSFRHMLRAVLAVQRMSIESSIRSSGSQDSQSRNELRQLKDIRLLTRFPPVFEDFCDSVREIPTQWSVVSLTILPPGATLEEGSANTNRLAAVTWWKPRHRRDQPEVRFFDAAQLLVLLLRFEQLMLENEESLRLKTRKEFWKVRLDIDKRMSKLMEDADMLVKTHLLPPELLKEAECDSQDAEVSGSKPVIILLLDAWSTPFSWEDVPTMRNFAICRGLTLPFLVHQLRTVLKWQPRCELVGSHQFVKWPIQSVSYVLDPDNNLAKTRSAFEPIVTTRTPPWTGFIGRFPTAQELLEQLRRTQMFLFIGHGSGLHATSFRDLGDPKANFAPSPTFNSSMIDKTKPVDSDLNIYSKPTAIGVLMGCSSMRLVDFRRRDLHNSALFFPLALSPAVFGNLFNVTDIDIDRFLMSFLDSALSAFWRRGFEGNKYHPPPDIDEKEVIEVPYTISLLDSLAKARPSCKLRFLNGSAPVCYGLPLAIIRECIDV